MTGDDAVLAAAAQGNPPAQVLGRDRPLAHQRVRSLLARTRLTGDERLHRALTVRPDLDRRAAAEATLRAHLRDAYNDPG